MARIRSVHPGQWTDIDFVRCSFAARLLAIALRNEADDNGVFVWEPLGLKMRLFPADNVDVAALLDELSANNQVRRFTESGKDYGVIRNFRRWQRPDKPKSWLPLPDELHAYAGIVAERSPKHPPPDDGNSPTSRRPLSDQSAKVSAEVGGRREEEGGNTQKAAAVPEAARETAQPPPPKPTDQRVIVGDRVLELARIDPASWMQGFSLIEAWLTAGYDPDQDIYPTVREIAARPNYKPPRSLKFFSAAIAERRAARVGAGNGQGASTGQKNGFECPPPKTAYEIAVDRYIAGGRQGPAPKLEDYPAAAA